MLFNLIMIALILAAIAYGLYRYYCTLSDVNDSDMTENDYTDVQTLRDKVSEQFSMMQRQDIREKNMTKAEYEQNQRRKAEIRINLKEAAYGNAKAKKNIKAYIMGFLLSEELGFGVNEHTIDDIIPFNNPDELHEQDKFEILLYVYYKYMSDDIGRPLEKKGFMKMLEDYKLFEPTKIDGEDMYDFTKERLEYIYEDVIKRVELTYQDKLEILAQRIFELYKGFGVVDMLFDTDIDEIDGGVSGISKDGYDIPNAKNLTFSYQSIWVTVRGVKMHLSCIGFDSQEELIRVVQNIYKYGANRVLNKKAGYVISTMKNGSRITVMRPPFGSSYAFFARKFDSTPSSKPEALINRENAIIPLTLIKWLIRGQRTIGITGAQGTGKSTMLKSLISFIDPQYTLRVQEISAELNLQYTYPNRNIVAFQETETIKSQEGLNFQKKTNGDINIIGEVAEAIQANFVIQTAQVASLFAMFTHHAKTSYDYVTAIANNLLDPVCGIYKEKKEAIETAAKILNIDIHLANKKGDRFMERITEIVPTKAEDYPTEKYPDAGFELDAREYFKRETDRKLFDCVNLMEYQIFQKANGETYGEYVLTNLPSSEMVADIKDHLSFAEEAEFDADMEMLKDVALKAREKHLEEAEEIELLKGMEKGEAV